MLHDYLNFNINSIAKILTEIFINISAKIFIK